MADDNYRGHTSEDISFAELRIQKSGDRLARADVRRALHGDSEPAGPAITLPEDPARQGQYRWLVEIHGLLGTTSAIPIEVVGDVVLGVWRGNELAPDFDFSIYCPDEKGVSRHHAMLRPTAKRLYLIDLESRHGTRMNNIPISSASVNEIQDGSMISLGILSFVLKIVERP